MHLFVDISSHGFGHLAIAAPVLNRLARECPALRLTVRSALPEHHLRERIHLPFAWLAEASDFGFAMQDATRVDLPATAARYREAHTNWPQRVQQEAALLRALGPDAVLTSVSYLPLAGARLAGIPAAAICSLNWADLFAHFFLPAGQPDNGATAIHAEMLAAYRAADVFLCITPGMDMPALGNVRPVGVVAARGQRHEIPAFQGERRVLVAMGGIRHRLPVEQWPALPGVRWLVPADWGVQHPQASAFERLGLGFTDLLASVDAVVTKPGYGTFTEAACNGTPVIYQRRDDWPEQDCLIDWLHQAGTACEVDAAVLQDGQLESALRQVWSAPPKPLPPCAGVAGAVAILRRLLRRPPA